MAATASGRTQRHTTDRQWAGRKEIIMNNDLAALPVSQESVSAAEAAIATHSESLGGIEGDAQVQVYHLLVSLHEYCVARAVDIDATLREVKEGLATGELGLPASEFYVKEKAIAALSPR
jgi:hypothetical protein